jgi:hypothetical protein
MFKIKPPIRSWVTNIVVDISVTWTIRLRYSQVPGDMVAICGLIGFDAQRQLIKIVTIDPLRESEWV